MAKFNVTLRGPEGFLDFGQYETYLHENAYDVTNAIMDTLRDDGYIRLSRANRTYSVTFKEVILSFSVRPVKEEEK